MGPIRSLGRSVALTKGHRWKVFGIMLLLGVGGAILGAIISMILRTLHIKLIFAVGEYAWQVMLIALQSIVYVVMYRDLRVAKEGVSTEEIAAVFD
jgi:uncharacterized membrane protein